jgi:MFS family permease
MANDSAAGPAPSGAHRTEPHRLYYGWYIVGAAFLTSFASLGLLYAFGAFFTSLSRSFTASHAAISGLFAVTLFIKAVFGAVAGRLADRFGPRVVVAVAGVVLGGGLLLASQATALWQLYVTYGLGLGLATGALYVTGLEVVERWFSRRRGEATGLAVAGVAVGNFVLPPLAALLIGWVGWRATFGLFGVGCFLLLLVAAWVVSPSPTARGLPFEDTDVGQPARGATTSTDWTVAQALRARPFWLLYGAIFATAWGYYLPIAEIVPDAEFHGIRPVVAATILGLIGAGSLVARLLAGVSDHLSRRGTWAAAFAGMAVMFGWWLTATSVWSLAVFATGFGLAGGIFFTLISPLAADYFGTRQIGAIVGLLLTALAPASLASPILAGFAFDRDQSYVLPIAIGLGANLLALACVLLLRAPEAPPAGMPVTS